MYRLLAALAPLLVTFAAVGRGPDDPPEQAASDQNKVAGLELPRAVSANKTYVPAKFDDGLAVLDVKWLVLSYTVRDDQGSREMKPVGWTPVGKGSKAAVYVDTPRREDEVVLVYCYGLVQKGKEAAWVTDPALTVIRWTGPPSGTPGTPPPVTPPTNPGTPTVDPSAPAALPDSFPKGLNLILVFNEKNAPRDLTQLTFDRKFRDQLSRAGCFFWRYDAAAPALDKLRYRDRLAGVQLPVILVVDSTQQIDLPGGKKGPKLLPDNQPIPVRLTGDPDKTRDDLLRTLAGIRR